MFGLFKDVTKEPGPKLEQKILKSAQEGFGFQLSAMAKDYAGLEIMNKRDDLRASFESHLDGLALEIGHCDNPRASLRQHIIRNIRTNVAYAMLANEENEENRQLLFDEINRWVTKTRQNQDAWNALAPALSEHEMFERPMDFTKVVHELAWSEVEGLVLRHLQIVLFKESNRPENDWSAMFREACELAVQNLYQMTLESGPTEDGLVHPILFLLTDDILFESAERVIACS